MREGVRPPQSRAILRDLLIVAAVGAGIWVAHRLGRIVLVLVLAMFFAYVIAPLVDLLQRPISLRGRIAPSAARRRDRGRLRAARGRPRGRRRRCSGRAPPRRSTRRSPAPRSTPNRSRTWEHGWTRYYERLRIPVELRHSIDESVLGAGDAAGAYARGSLLALIGVLSDLPWLVLVPVLAFLMLKDAAVDPAHDPDGAAAPGPAARPPAVRGAERDAGGLRPRAADRVRGGGHPVGRSASHCSATRTRCCSACWRRCWSSSR